MVLMLILNLLIFRYLSLFPYLYSFHCHIPNNKFNALVKVEDVFVEFYYSTSG